MSRYENFVLWYITFDCFTRESSENDKKLAAPFRLSRPMLCSVDIQEARQASKSLPYSMNWTCVDGDAMEIVDTSTGL